LKRREPDLENTLTGESLTAGTTFRASAVALLRAEDFDELVRLHQKRIYRVVFSLVRDGDAADTLTQECFLRAYQSRAQFRGECRVDTWLVRIAVNLARDHLRNRRRAFWSLLLRRDPREEGETGVPDCADPTPSPERVLLGREQAAFVWDAAAALPVQQRTVFLLRFAEEMTLEEISHATQLEMGTVKSHLHRALGAIRKRIRTGEEK
jgi:RNA polymerase sigma-70 factor (ECF subfamily)